MVKQVPRLDCGIFPIDGCPPVEGFCSFSCWTCFDADEIGFPAGKSKKSIFQKENPSDKITSDISD